MDRVPRGETMIADRCEPAGIGSGGTVYGFAPCWMATSASQTAA
jgi:hypothetical protein